ncbi:TetR family transcriptional regulator [Williamsia sp. Leaf354]|uniref:TetR/AcrR family transcriptional regulator n=1 Tax=Williamsia sp. Leaf354 TaxID=1736349 RepID=UPI0006FB1C99|nr:TetR/AcrR family transcriptional regulator [Williamsia sp. Leaf354]KQS00250.1 TetR family transcriptional regulator [Williamsia sp. Leaf354]
MDRERMVDVAVSVVSRFGAQALNLTSVARHAGVGRATAYRMFGGRDELLAAIVDREVSVLHDRMDSWMLAVDDPHDKVHTLVTKTLAYIREHEALQYLLRNEPGELVSTLVASGPDRATDTTIIDVIVQRCLPDLDAQPALAGALHPDGRGASEFAARVVYSHMLVPGSSMTDDQVADLVCRAVLGG